TEAVTAVVVRTRAELRRRLVSTVLLAVLLAVASAVVLVSLAGARRTDTALDRFLAASRASDVNANSETLSPAQARRIDGVEDVGQSGYVFLDYPDFGTSASPIVPFAAADNHVWRTIDRPQILS